MYRQAIRTATKYAKRVAPYAVKYGPKLAAKAFELRNNRKRVASNPTTNIVTTQRDFRSVKKRKYNPKKNEKQKRFAKKIQKALAPKQELNVYSETFPTTTINSFGSVAGNIAGQVVCNSIMMNTGKLSSSSQNTGFIMGRYQNIGGSTNATSNKGAKSTIPNNQFEIHVTNSTMDLSITNPPSGLQQTIYDVYEFVAAKNISEAAYADPYTAWNQCLLDNYSPTDATTLRPFLSINGQTPYDCPMLGKYWKVLKTTRLLITQGNTTEYKMNCGKFTLTGELFQNQYAISGITRGVVIVAGVGDNTSWPLTQGVLRFVPQKTWHFKFAVGDSELEQRPTVLLQTL